MSKIVLLGSSGALGSFVASLLEEATIDFYIVTRNPKDRQSKSVYWDYQSSIPKEIRSADCVINCARGPSFRANVTVAKILIREVLPTTRLVLMGSNCIFSEPLNKFQRIFFSGDAYITEKRTIEKLAESHENVIIIRPTIVRDEGGWSYFLKDVEHALRVNVPSDCRGSVLKIIDSADVARCVVDIVLNENHDPIPEELFSDTIKLSDFLGDGKIVYKLSNNTFFESNMKNFLASILCSRLLPFWLKALIQERTRRPHRFLDNPKKDDFYLEGMSRLYLCGRHTRQ